MNPGASSPGLIGITPYTLRCRPRYRIIRMVRQVVVGARVIQMDNFQVIHMVEMIILVCTILGPLAAVAIGIVLVGIALGKIRV